MESSRRQQAQADLGMDFSKEDQKREAALAKEQERINKKEVKRQEMMNRQSYRLMASTAKYMTSISWILFLVSSFLQVSVMPCRACLHSRSSITAFAWLSRFR